MNELVSTKKSPAEISTAAGDRVRETPLFTGNNSRHKLRKCSDRCPGGLKWNILTYLYIFFFSDISLPVGTISDKIAVIPDFTDISFYTSYT